MLLVVVYDIADNKRRLRLSNFLEGYGRRVQESVFECFITLDDMKVLHKVKPTEDNVRFYWIPADSVPRTLVIGGEPPTPPPDYYIL